MFTVAELFYDCNIGVTVVQNRNWRKPSTNLPITLRDVQGGDILLPSDIQKLLPGLQKYASLGKHEIALQRIQEFNQQVLSPNNNPPKANTQPAPTWRPKPRIPKTGYVYLIHLATTQLYKIGFSKNPQQRCTALQKVAPAQLTILHIIETEDMVHTEQKLHGRFSNKRRNGEWFELDQQDLDYILSL